MACRARTTDQQPKHGPRNHRAKIVTGCCDGYESSFGCMVVYNNMSAFNPRQEADIHRRDTQTTSQYGYRPRNRCQNGRSGDEANTIYFGQYKQLLCVLL